MPLSLKTKYLGLELPHPLIVGASPLVDHLDKVREIEDSGAAALVMHSLFEEQFDSEAAGEAAHILSHEESFGEATSLFPRFTSFTLEPDAYLERLAKIKEMVSMPVIGSLNGRTTGGWISYAADIEQAGADALELNLYFQPSSEAINPITVEDDAINVVKAVRDRVKIPVSVKISPYFTSVPYFVKRLVQAGADGVVLFNRFYQPDIDLEELQHRSELKLSDSSELLLRLRWLAILRDRFSLTIACNGGVHTGEDAVKAILSGADGVQVVSALLRHGPARLAEIKSEMETAMDVIGYETVEEMRGCLSYQKTPNPEAVERANYLRLIQSWRV